MASALHKLRAMAHTRRSKSQDTGFGMPRLLLLPMLMGIGAGIGAVAYRVLIALFHNLFFSGTWSLDYDANIHAAASPWGSAILLPIAVALGVA